MESKYYTPENSEFHVGLNFEVFIDEIEAWIVFTYSQYTFFSEVIKGGWSGDGFTIAEKLPMKKVRVKHLDRGDIESEGWGVNMRGYSGEGQGHNGPVTFERYVKGEYELMHFSDNTVHIFQPYDDQRVNTKFEGTIKNKSKLKDVLKMIGI